MLCNVLTVVDVDCATASSVIGQSTWGPEGRWRVGWRYGASVRDVDLSVIGREGEAVWLALGVVDDVDGAGGRAEAVDSAGELGGGGYPLGAGTVGVVWEGEKRRQFGL